jgi:hypothetical protein
MTMQNEAIAFGELSIRILKMIKKNQHDKDALELWESLRSFDAIWRENIGLPNRPEIARSASDFATDKKEH